MYQYLIQIICEQLDGFKYSYLILIIYTQLYSFTKLFISNNRSYMVSSIPN